MWYISAIMLKALTIFAVLLLGTTIYVTIEDQHAAEQAPQQTAQQPNSAVTFGVGDNQPKNDTQKSSRNPPSWHRFFTWPDGMTAWAILLTLWAIAWQSNETKKAAQAAQKTVQIMVNSERPWLIAYLKQMNGSCLLDNGNMRLTWEVKNVGKTPAKILEVGARLSLDTLGPSLESPPDYGNPQSLDERILVPDAIISFYVFWSITENGKLRSRIGKDQSAFNDLVIGFGYVKYRSATNEEGSYITRFCDSGNIDGGIVSEPFTVWDFAGAEYTKCT